MRIALGIEYNGAKFSGWQIQSHRSSVQQQLEEALSKVAAEKIHTSQVAGRTDKGVHATAQVMHFDTQSDRPENAWVRGTNRYLEDRNISVLWAKQVSMDFHARFSAKRRRYRYVLLNREIRPSYLHQLVSWDNRPLQLQPILDASHYLLGKHDFNAYRTVHCQSNNPIKTIYSLSITKHQDFFYFDVEADAFLHHMVRNIVGVMMEIGRGERQPVWAKEVLETKDRTKAGITAPSDGLYLTRVSYDDVFAIPNIAYSEPQF